MNNEEDKLQIEIYTWFHNNYPHLRNCLNYNLNNPRNAIQGAIAKRMGLRPGRPDLTLNYQGRTYLIELKTKTGKLSPVQISYHQNLAAQGFPVDVIRSLSEFKEWCFALLTGEPLPTQP
jgi:hypothetical protein